MVPGGEGPPSLISVARRDAAHAAEANTAWLEDCSARLLCVLALDRFGDYVSDKVYIFGLATPVILPGSWILSTMPHMSSLAIVNITRMAYWQAGSFAEAHTTPRAPLARKEVAGLHTVLPDTACVLFMPSCRLTALVARKQWPA